MDLLSAGVALSLHLGFYPEDFNDVHPYVEYNFSPEYTVGIMKNSEHRASVYAKYNYVLDDDWTVEYGLATGYDDIPVVPLIRLVYTYSDNYSYWAMPGYHVDPSSNEKKLGAVVGVQIKF